MIGVLEMFAEFSTPDAFHVQAQLELFAWARNRRKVTYERDRRAWLRILRPKPIAKVYPIARCSHHGCPREKATDRRLCAHHLALNAMHAKAARQRRAA